MFTPFFTVCHTWSCDTNRNWMLPTLPFGYRPCPPSCICSLSLEYPGVIPIRNFFRPSATVGLFDQGVFMIRVHLLQDVTWVWWLEWELCRPWIPRTDEWRVRDYVMAIWLGTRRRPGCDAFVSELSWFKHVILARTAAFLCYVCSFSSKTPARARWRKLPRSCWRTWRTLSAHSGE